MSVLVVSGAQYQCSGGAGPGILNATQGQILAEGKPILTIKDGAGFVNVLPCPNCICPTHPVIASILSVTGTIVPQPCTPQTSGMWIATQTKLVTSNAPCLSNDSQILCAMGGMITITNPGQGKVII